MEAAFLSLMPFVCTLTPRATSTGVVGESTYGTAITPNCHIEYKAQTIISATGVEKQQVGIVYLDGVYPVTTTWKLVIPVPGGTSTVEIIGVDQNSDETGYHHTALRFGAL